MPGFPELDGPPFAIFSGENLLNVIAYTATCATGTPVSGHAASNVLTTKIYNTWTTPAAGPHTLRLTDPGFGRSANVFVIASPAGRPMVGDVTMIVRNFVGSIVLSETLPNLAVDGLPDRRFLFVDDSVTVKHLDLICASGSEIGRVFIGESIDLTGLTRDDWKTAIHSLGRVQFGGSIGTWSVRDQQERPRRAKATSCGIKAGFLHQILPLKRAFLANGKLGEVVWLPRAAEPTDSVGLIEMMHRTGIYGRYSAPLRIRRGDTRVVASGFLAGETLRTFDLSTEFKDFY